MTAHNTMALLKREYTNPPPPHDAYPPGNDFELTCIKHITHYEKRSDGSMKLENPILRYNEIEIFSNILCVSVYIVRMQMNQDGSL